MSFLSARIRTGLSQATVAEKLGISAASVCQWETGKTMPDPRKLPKIAEILNCTVDELLIPDSTENKSRNDST